MNLVYRIVLLILGIEMVVLAAGLGFGTAMVQRVTPYPEELRAATGELGAIEGEPVEAFILDRSAVLEVKDGITYLDSTRAYPIQVRTVLLIAVPEILGMVFFAGYLRFRLRRSSLSPSLPGANPS